MAQEVLRLLVDMLMACTQIVQARMELWKTRADQEERIDVATRFDFEAQWLGKGKCPPREPLHVFGRPRPHLYSGPYRVTGKGGDLPRRGSVAESASSTAPAPTDLDHTDLDALLHAG